MSLPPATRDALPTMVTPLLPSSASSAMSAAVASVARIRAVAAKSRDGGAWHFPSLSPSLDQGMVQTWVGHFVTPLKRR